MVLMKLVVGGQSITLTSLYGCNLWWVVGVVGDPCGIKGARGSLCLCVCRDLILGEDALLYITYVMLIWAPLITATRWRIRVPR